jgi:antitoxin YefM
MTIHTTYTNARANLAKLLDQVTNNQEIVIIQRRGDEDVAVISALELAGFLETAHLLRSPKNAERLLEALGRALKNERKSITVESLRQEVRIDEETN